MSITTPAAKTVRYALACKAARKYIIDNPGCTPSEIFAKTGLGQNGLSKLTKLKLIRRTQRMEPGFLNGRKCVQRYYPVAMEGFDDERI